MPQLIRSLLPHLKLGGEVSDPPLPNAPVPGSPVQVTVSLPHGFSTHQPLLAGFYSKKVAPPPPHVMPNQRLTGRKGRKEEKEVTTVKGIPKP